MKAFYSIAEFQELLSVSRSTVVRMNARGVIRFVHVGTAVRIPRQDVDRVVASLEGQTFGPQGTDELRA